MRCFIWAVVLTAALPAGVRGQIVSLPPVEPTSDLPPSSVAAPSYGFSDPSPSAFAEAASFDAFAPPASEADRISSIEKRLDDFIKGTKATTYPTVKINGVFQADAASINQDNVSFARYGNIRDGADFRRARLAASGSLTETTNYFLQMDFAFFGHPTFTDLWVEQTDLPILGNVRVGQWKQPFSLEVVSSFRYTTFAERSVLFQPFTPFRHLGVGFYNRNKAQTMTWAASTFAAGQDQFGGSISASGGIGTAERITLLPYYDDCSGVRHYLHLGLGHHFTAPNEHVFNFRTIPELYIGQFAPSAATLPNQQPTPGLAVGMPFFLATGIIPVRNFNVLGTELLWVNGPLSVQSELMGNYVELIGQPNQFFYGGYAQVGYFLTGEHRPYDRKAGAIDRIKPFENVFCVRTKDGCHCSGWGAWEVAARFSTLNLRGDYNGVAAFPGDLRNGGVITDVTGGLNWYLNPYWKCQFNYIHSQTSNQAGADAITHLFDLRTQMDF